MPETVNIALEQIHNMGHEDIMFLMAMKTFSPVTGGQISHLGQIMQLPQTHIEDNLLQTALVNHRVEQGIINNKPNGIFVEAEFLPDPMGDHYRLTPLGSNLADYFLTQP